jgi:hypothetical protein
MKAFAHVLRAAWHKHGVRPTSAPINASTGAPNHSRARIEFAQAEMTKLFPRGLPEKRPRDLLRKVREALAQNPDWQRQGYKPISRRTVKRAWRELLKP